jgi:hypothetical protein
LQTHAPSTLRSARNFLYNSVLCPLSHLGKTIRSTLVKLATNARQRPAQPSRRAGMAPHINMGKHLILCLQTPLINTNTAIFLALAGWLVYSCAPPRPFMQTALLTPNGTTTSIFLRPAAQSTSVSGTRTAASLEASASLFVPANPGGPSWCAFQTVQTQHLLLLAAHTPQPARALRGF